jgi:uncharacterized delta-60 repeat protein
MFIQFKHLTWKASLLATVVSLLAFTVVLAAPGDLDTTFGGDGRVISFPVPSNPGRSDTVFGLEIQADGKIIAAGFSGVPSTATSDFALIRYNTDGTLDSTFSADGRQITNFGGIDQAYDVALQPNGKIVVAGQKCNNTFTICDVALARHNVGGALDITFSEDGKQTTDFGADDNGAFAVAIQSNGKIVAAGYMWNGTDYDFAVYRYLANGTLDSTFSGDGMARFGFGAGRQDFAGGLVIQVDGKIVVAGESGDVDYVNNNFAVARLNPNGSLDTTFSGDGRQITNMGGDDYAYGVALQADGKIVVVGEKGIPGISYFALARYNTNGSLDTTFNTTGRKVFSIVSGVDSVAVAVRVQANGQIVVAGRTGEADFADFALVRLNSSGGFDTTFSGNGKATVDFGGDDYGRALALQTSDGKYVIGGFTADGTQRDFALARILP